VKPYLLIALLSISFLYLGCGSGGTSSSPAAVKNQSILSEKAPSSPELEALTQKLLKESSDNLDPSIQNELKTVVENSTLNRSILRSDMAGYTYVPKNKADLYRLLSIFALIERSVASALWTSSTAVSLNASDPAVLAQMGAVLNEAKRYSEAKMYLLKSIEILYNSATAHMSLAITYEALGDIDRAVYEAGVALSLYPESPIIIENIRSLYSDLGKTDAAKSISDLIDIENSEISPTLHIPSTEDLGQLDNLSNHPEITNTPTGGNQAFVQEYLQCTLTHFDTISKIAKSIADSWDYHTNIYENELALHSRQGEQCADACGASYSCPCSCATPPLGADLTSLDKLLKNTGGLNTQYKSEMAKSILLYQECAYETHYKYSENLSRSELDWADNLADLTVDVHYGNLKDIYNSYTDLVEMYLYTMDSRISAIQMWCGSDIPFGSEGHEDNISASDALQSVTGTAQGTVGKPYSLPEKYEVCNPAFCIGKDDSSYSFKLNLAVASVKLSADTDKMELGITAGIGIDDLTGGNIAGVSFELSSSVDIHGNTSVGVKGSATGAAGTEELVFFELMAKRGGK
jgi:tetratricopeptide (TPR) repeat protein